MKTYTSQAVFLLTTLVNMARARPSSETELINTVALEIFQVRTYVRDTSKPSNKGTKEGTNYGIL